MGIETNWYIPFHKEEFYENWMQINVSKIPSQLVSFYLLRKYEKPLSKSELIICIRIFTNRSRANSVYLESSSLYSHTSSSRLLINLFTLLPLFFSPMTTSSFSHAHLLFSIFGFRGFHEETLYCIEARVDEVQMCETEEPFKWRKMPSIRP